LLKTEVRGKSCDHDLHRSGEKKGHLHREQGYSAELHCATIDA
jgi:hypothetical protein